MEQPEGLVLPDPALECLAGWLFSSASERDWCAFSGTCVRWREEAERPKYRSRWEMGPVFAYYDRFLRSPTTVITPFQRVVGNFFLNSLRNNDDAEARYHFFYAAKRSGLTWVLVLLFNSLLARPVIYGKSSPLVIGVCCGRREVAGRFYESLDKFRTYIRNDSEIRGSTGTGHTVVFFTPSRYTRDIAALDFLICDNVWWHDPRVCVGTTWYAGARQQNHDTFLNTLDEAQYRLATARQVCTHCFYAQRGGENCNHLPRDIMNAQVD